MQACLFDVRMNSSPSAKGILNESQDFIFRKKSIYGLARAEAVLGIEERSEGLQTIQNLNTKQNEQETLILLSSPK